MGALISVIMLTYNRENFVEKAIKAILSQTYTNFEFIIVDNGSQDKSGEICDRMALTDERIKVIHVDKGTIGFGRNVGLNHANGDYITFVDDDDIAYPEMLELLVNLIEQGEHDISVCGSHRDEDGIVSNKYVFEGTRVFTGADGVKELLRRELYNSANPTKLFKRRLFQTLRYDELGKYDDIRVMYKLFAEADSVIANGKPMYCFYRHIGNNSDFTRNNYLLNPDQLDEYFAAFSERTRYLCDKFPKEKAFFRYTEWSYMLSMYDKIVSHKLSSCIHQKLCIEENLKENYDEVRSSVYMTERERKILASIADSV